MLATTASAAVTPEKLRVTEFMNNYDLDNQNNSLQLACEIGQFVSEEYGWNCDIRELIFTKHAPIYINVFYPAANNKKGYEAYYGWFGPQKNEVTRFTGKDRRMYYRDWYESGKECYISGVRSYPIVKSYFGNVTSTAPVRTQEKENTKPPRDEIPIQSMENSTIINASNNQNEVSNSTNTVNNQGVIDKIEQYWFDFSNTYWSNVTLNFFGH
jgi:hypothetical protein